MLHRLLASTTLACALLMSAATAQAQTHSERFSYRVSFGDVRLATVRIHTGCPAKRHLPAALYAFSQGVASQIHSFAIRLDSFMASARTRSHEGRTRITEEGATRSYRSRFRTPPAVKTTTTRGGKTTTATHKLPAASHDLLSWVYALRALPKLAPRATHAFIVWDGWKLVRLDAKVGASTSLSTPHKRYRAATPVHVTRTRLHHKSGPKQFLARRDGRDKLGTVWFLDDAARTPAGMVFHSPIGSVKILLETVTTKPCP